jgi:hypothetical protein
MHQGRSVRVKYGGAYLMIVMLAVRIDQGIIGGRNRSLNIWNLRHH